MRGSLASIRPFVDGIFIYVTGSTDGTFAIVEKLNRGDDEGHDDAGAEGSEQFLD